MPTAENAAAGAADSALGLGEFPVAFLTLERNNRPTPHPSFTYSTPTPSRWDFIRPEAVALAGIVVQVEY